MKDYGFAKARMFGPFLRGKVRRDDSVARQEWAALAANICPTAPYLLVVRADDRKVDPTAELETLLNRWAVECPLNIEWYERAQKERRFVWAAANIIVLVVASAGMIAAAALAFKAKDMSSSPNATVAIAAEISFGLAAFLGLLRLFAGVADVKAQCSIFWDAGSNLKEALYRFQDEWRDRATQDTSMWNRDATFIEFKSALREQIRFAKSRTAREQREYFQTFKSPTELIDSATSAMDAIDAKAGKLVAMRLRDLPPGASCAPSPLTNAMASHDRAQAGSAEIMSLQVELARLVLIRNSRQKTGEQADPAFDAQIEAKQNDIARASERLELSRRALEDTLRLS